MSQQDAKLSTVREVADRFKVSERTVYRWTDSGQLEALLVGGRFLRFEESEIKRFMNLRRRARNRKPPHVQL